MVFTGSQQSSPFQPLCLMPRALQYFPNTKFSFTTASTLFVQRAILLHAIISGKRYHLVPTTAPTRTIAPYVILRIRCQAAPFPPLFNSKSCAQGRVVFARKCASLTDRCATFGDWHRKPIIQTLNLYLYSMQSRAQYALVYERCMHAFEALIMHFLMQFLFLEDD